MKILILLVVTGVFLWTGCKEIEVLSFYNESVDFGQYQTYSIDNPTLRGKEFSKEGSKSLENIEEAIEYEMNARNYDRSARADLIVLYRLTIENKVDYQADPAYPSYTTYYGYPPYIRAKEYKEGILQIEIKDTKTRKLIWHGSLDLHINKRSKKGPPTIVKESVAMIYAEYPFAAGASKPVKTLDQ